MANFLTFCCINCWVMCYIFWSNIWSAEAEKITTAAGSRVNLNCSSRLTGNLTMVTWKMNSKNLFTLSRKNHEIFNESVQLDFKMPKLQGQLSALIIEDVQKSHEGNYTCETVVDLGLDDMNWELIITDGKKSSDKRKIALIAGFPTLSFLILASVLAILAILKRRAKKRSPTHIMQQKQVEEIYENHLEIQRRQASNNRC